ncbi:MAG: hypothetical protein ACRD51_16265 [Candidatus Acidiferrum sp.]
MENFSALAARRNNGETWFPQSLYRVSEAAQHPIRACSACAGDYEDPDRTAWKPAVEDEDELPEASEPEESSDETTDGTRTVGEGRDDEFPAQEE